MGRPTFVPAQTAASPAHDQRAWRGVVAALALSLAAAGAIVADGWDPAVAVLTYLGPTGAITVIAVLVIRDRVRSLQRQLVLAGAVTVGGLAISVALFVDAMYVSSHDAVFTVLLTGYGLLIGVWSAWLLGRQALRRVAIAEIARRDLVGAVSHELRTPITSLRLLAEAIDDDLVDAETRQEYLARMTMHLQALSALIADLLELFRLETGDIRCSTERVSLSGLVHEAIDALRADAEARDVTLRAELAPNLPAVRADPEQLQRGLINLVRDTIRRTPSGGSVVVWATPHDHELQIEVADAGAPIPEDERERVLHPRFRGGTERGRGDSGLGLGAAICGAIVEAHGGRVWLRGSGPGTRIRFSVPAAKPYEKRRHGS